MSDQSTRDGSPDHAPRLFDDSPLSDKRRAELAPKLHALLTELVKIRELEQADGEPATPWPWGESGDVR
jgi:hypothetical protein